MAIRMPVSVTLLKSLQVSRDWESGILIHCAIGEPVRMPTKLALLFMAIAIRTPLALAASPFIDGLYVHTYGSNTDPALIFVHGGPGFNSQDFETTTAEPLSQLGYYVVTYDERGQGRSAAAARSAYTYKAYADDLLLIMSSLKIKQPILIGHSHGGPISIKFDELNPGVARAIILVSGPINFWNVMKDMYQNCSVRYHAWGQDSNIPDLEKNFAIISASITGSEELVNPVADIFGHAARGCKLFFPLRPTPESWQLRAITAKDPAPMDENSMPGFLINQSYIYLDNSKQVQTHKGRYFGIYGDEDATFSPNSLNEIKQALNDESNARFFLVHGASHYVYLDQQPEFLQLVNQIVRSLNN